MLRMPDGNIKCPTFVRLENADVSIRIRGLLLNRISLMFEVPAKALPSIRCIWLWLSRIVDRFWSPANANCATICSGVYCMDSSRNRGKPRKANCLIRVILLPSSESFFSARSPANESGLMMGKLFFVSARFSTVAGSWRSGICSSPPVLHSTCTRHRGRERERENECESEKSKWNRGV